MKAARGFTLIEVMVALLVIGVGYAGVIVAIGRFADQRAMLRERVPAHYVAWNRSVETLLAARGWVQPSPAQGVAGQGGQSWRWAVRESKARGEGLWREEVVVRRAQAAESQQSSAALHVFVQR